MPPDSGMHAHVGVAPQLIGSARHAYCLVAPGTPGIVSLQYSAPPRHVSAPPHAKRLANPASSQRHPLDAHVQLAPGGRPMHAHEVTKTIPSPHVHAPESQIGGETVSPHAPPLVPKAHCAGRPTHSASALASLLAPLSLADASAGSTALSSPAPLSPLASRAIIASALLSPCVLPSGEGEGDGAPQCASARAAAITSNL